MILKNKKALNPITFIFMSLVVVLILFILTIFLLQTKNVIIDEHKKNSQLIITKILNEDCFSDEFAVIKSEAFNQNNLNKCLENFNNYLVRIYLLDNKIIYKGNKEEFEQKSSFCNYANFCFESKIPIILEKNSNREKNMLTLQIIEK